MARLSKEEAKRRRNIEKQVIWNRNYKEKNNLKQIKFEVTQDKYDLFDSKLAEKGLTKKQFLENAIDQYKSAFMKAYEQGLKDGSVRKQDNIDLFYFSTTHAVLELCKKLALKAVLNQDLAIEKLGEVRCLINIVLNTLKQ